MRMIPAIISQTCASKAERRLFEWLRTSQNTDDWICMHSVRLQGYHRYKRMAEIDFLLLTPLGILVLEVKGGRVYKKGHRQWLYQDGTGRLTPKHEGPFEQVSGAMHTLEQWMSKHSDLGKLHSVLQFGWGVAMPDMAPFDWGAEVDADQVYDISHRGNSVYHTVQRMMNVAQHVSQAQSRRPPTQEERELIAQTLTGESSPVAKLELERQIATNLLEDTYEHMFESLNTWGHHEQLLIQTPAGTGGIAFATEAIARLGESSQNIGILTPTNHPDAKELIAASPDGLCARPAHNLPHMKALFVLDAHQIEHKHLSGAFERLVGGIEQGRWIVMHDMRNLATADEDTATLLKYLDQCGETQTLVHNVCHTTGITGIINALCDPTLRLTSNIPGPRPQVSTYVDHAQLTDHLHKILSQILEDGGISTQNIMILVCQASQKDTVQQLIDGQALQIPVMTVTEATGLMADVVIMTGIKHLSKPVWRDLVYQGAGKARFYLSLMFEQAAMQDYIEIITAGFIPR